MSSEPQAGILEVASEHGEKKVVEGSSAVPHPPGFVGRTDDAGENVEDEKREPDETHDRGSEAQGGNVKNQSMMSAFRDFFLAAFSDSYSYQDVRSILWVSILEARRLSEPLRISLYPIRFSTMVVVGPTQPTARFREAANPFRRNKIVFGRKTHPDRTTSWSHLHRTIPAENGERSLLPLRSDSITRTT
jgi:hypothetical protein